MHSLWEFPKSINVCRVNYEIRSDYRDVLNIINALNDPDTLGDSEQETAIIRGSIMLEIMYVDFQNIPQEHLEEALKCAKEFIDMGITEDSKKPRIMDWEQDAHAIIPAINKTLNTEIRACEYLHWWTFLGAYMEIGESLFSSILNIRQKKLKGKKLEIWEEEFYKENKSIIDLKSKSQRSTEEKEKLREYFGYKKT